MINTTQKSRDNSENFSSEDKMEIDIREPTIGSTATTASEKGQANFTAGAVWSDCSLRGEVCTGWDSPWARAILCYVYLDPYLLPPVLRGVYGSGTVSWFGLVCGIPSVLRASTTSALRFHRKTTNDTLDFQGIYCIVRHVPVGGH